jgi:hypothetical protein
MTTSIATATPASTPAVVGWAILEMHQNQLRTMVRGMGATEREAWLDAFGTNGKRSKWARAEALDSEEWEYWSRFYGA